MKNVLTIILSIIVAIIISSMFMGISNDTNDLPVISSNSSVKVFQIGAYKDINLANNQVSTIGGKIIKDNDMYYVYYSILASSSNIERMINYLNNKGIYYYVKTISVSESFYNELLRYEELMKETTTDVAFLELNKRLLEIYGGSNEN